MSRDKVSPRSQKHPLSPQSTVLCEMPGFVLLLEHHRLPDHSELASIPSYFQKVYLTRITIIICSIPPFSHSRTPPIQIHTHTRTIRPPLTRIRDRHPILLRHLRITSIIRFVDARLARRASVCATAATTALPVGLGTEAGLVTDEAGG